jgi:hypothetical protein
MALDIKTGAKADWHVYQIAAYCLATCRPRGATVRISKTGHYTVDFYNAEAIALAQIEFKKYLAQYHNPQAATLFGEAG